MRNNVILTYILISILGVVSIVLPTFFLPNIQYHDSPLFPMIRKGIEGISLWSFTFLFLSGFTMKFFTKLSDWKIGFSTMALFPIFAILEMMVDLSSHKSFPIEFIFYAIYTVPAMLGADISQVVQKLILKLKSDSEEENRFL